MQQAILDANDLLQLPENASKSVDDILEEMRQKKLGDAARLAAIGSGYANRVTALTEEGDWLAATLADVKAVRTSMGQHGVKTDETTSKRRSGVYSPEELEAAKRMMAEIKTSGHITPTHTKTPPDSVSDTQTIAYNVYNAPQPEEVASERRALLQSMRDHVGQSYQEAVKNWGDNETLASGHVFQLNALDQIDPNDDVVAQLERIQRTYLEDRDVALQEARNLRLGKQPGEMSPSQQRRLIEGNRNSRLGRFMPSERGAKTWDEKAAAASSNVRYISELIKFAKRILEP